MGQMPCLDCIERTALWDQPCLSGLHDKGVPIICLLLCPILPICVHSAISTWRISAYPGWSGMEKLSGKLRSTEVIQIFLWPVPHVPSPLALLPHVRLKSLASHYSGSPPPLPPLHPPPPPSPPSHKARWKSAHFHDPHLNPTHHYWYLITGDFLELERLPTSRLYFFRICRSHICVFGSSLPHVVWKQTWHSPWSRLHIWSLLESWENQSKHQYMWNKVSDYHVWVLCELQKYLPEALVFWQAERSLLSLPLRHKCCRAEVEAQGRNFSVPQNRGQTADSVGRVQFRFRPYNRLH